MKIERSKYFNRAVNFANYAKNLTQKYFTLNLFEQK